MRDPATLAESAVWKGWMLPAVVRIFLGLTSRLAIFVATIVYETFFVVICFFMCCCVNDHLVHCKQRERWRPVEQKRERLRRTAAR